MNNYMMMHDVVFNFLYAMMNMPLQNIISHLVYYTIEVSGNIYECDGFKISNKLFNAQELSKDTTTVYPVAVIQLGDKLQEFQEYIKATNTQVKGSGQETVVLNLVVGSNTKTHSVDMDQLM